MVAQTGRLASQAEDMARAIYAGTVFTLDAVLSDFVNIPSRKTSPKTTMRIHLLSDLHVEIHPFTPTPTDADVVVLAGDIHSEGRTAEWALDTFSIPVVLVAGNHDFYGTEIESTQKKFARIAANSQGRLHFLENQSVIINGVRFLGATAWTDFRFGGNVPLAKFDADRTMNDYRAIRKGTSHRRLRPDDTEAYACATRTWLENTLSTPFDGPTVLVTHHPITAHPLDTRRAPTPLDAAFYNAWEHLFFEPFHAPDLVIHGHTHFSVDTWPTEDTRVISNPRGYPGERTGFDEGLVVIV